MANFIEFPCYSPRFISALSQVAEWHKFQVRKMGNVPYISHLLSVSALVFESGGSEDEAIAALCHDAVEDVGIELSQIEELFGETVAAIVAKLSEDDSLEKVDRKAAYIRTIDNSNYSVALVSACDKLHNLRGYCQSPQLVKPDIIEFYIQLFDVYKIWLDRNSLYFQHPVIFEMWELIENKLLRVFSVYVGKNYEDEDLLRYWVSDRPMSGKHLRVATSSDIIDMAFSKDWEEMPEILKLADGEFKKADLKSQQDALKPQADPQLEALYRAMGRRLD